MSYSLSFRFPTALLLGAALLLGGCCANEVCDCQDAQADAVEVRFASGFSARDLDTLIVKRFPRPRTPTSRADSVVIVQRPTLPRDSIAVVLNNSSPFAPIGTNKLDRFSYEIRYLTQQPGQKPRPTTILTIDSVALSGQFDADGCCACYTNSVKIVKATVNRKRPGPVPDSSFVIDLKLLASLKVPK